MSHRNYALSLRKRARQLLAERRTRHPSLPDLFKCHNEKMKKYRPDVLTDSNYWADEPIEED